LLISKLQDQDIVKKSPLLWLKDTRKEVEDIPEL
jgi:hypothetical protein